VGKDPKVVVDIPVELDVIFRASVPLLQHLYRVAIVKPQHPEAEGNQ
jgi:hypothetical protein